MVSAKSKKRLLFVYSLSGIKPKLKSRFLRELFGYEDFSNFAKYSYSRKGLLSKKDFSKPFPSMFILRKSGRKKIKKLRNLFRKYGIRYRIYLIDGGAGI